MFTHPQKSQRKENGGRECANRAQGDQYDCEDTQQLQLWHRVAFFPMSLGVGTVACRFFFQFFAGLHVVHCVVTLERGVGINLLLQTAGGFALQLGAAFDKVLGLIVFCLIRHLILCFVD